MTMTVTPPPLTDTDLDLDLDDDAYLIEDDATKAARYAAELEDQFAIFPMVIFADVRAKKLTPRDVCLYIHLLAKEGSNKFSYWSIGALALLTDTSGSTVKESLRRLVQCGHIRRVPRGVTSAMTTCLTKRLRRQGVNRLYIRGKAQKAEGRADQSQPTQPAARRQQAPDAPTLPECDLESEDTKAFLREVDEYLAS